MNFTIIELQPFYIIGIAIQTTNENGQAQKDIGNLWQRFYKEDIIHQIPGKVNTDIYCMYTDYESNAASSYTTILGCRVTSLEHTPDSLTGKSISQATYRVYTSTGKLPDSVLTTWEHIWQTPIRRRYLADFDVYVQQIQEPDRTEVKTYVSVQEKALQH